MDKDKLTKEYQNLVYSFGQISLEIEERETAKKEIISKIQTTVSRIKEILAEEAEAKKAEKKPLELVKDAIKKDEPTEDGIKVVRSDEGEMGRS